MQLPLENLPIYAEMGYEVIITGETDGVKIGVKRKKNGEKFGIYKRISSRMMATADISGVAIIEQMIEELNHGIESYAYNKRVQEVLQ